MATAFIPAKSTSKRIKDKNLIVLGGVPLIDWTLRACELWDFIDEIVVATDCPRVKKHVENRANIFDLKDEDTGDKRTVSNLWKHFVTTASDNDDHVLLHCTNPFRSLTEMKKINNIFNEKKYDIIISVKGIYHCILDDQGKLSKEDISGRMTTLTQERSPKYELDGSYYISTKNYIHKCKYYEEGKVYPFEVNLMNSLEIDVESDLKTCCAIANPIGFEQWWDIYGN